MECEKIKNLNVHVGAQWLSSVQLFVTPQTSTPGSSVHGISQARTLEWAAISFSRGSLQFRDRTRVSCVSCIGKQILYQ